MNPLTAPARAYDWGSPTAIPEFLGESATGRPVAELWLGTHALAPSEVDLPDGRRLLSEVVGDLSFMLKVLAPAQPLSIQVHPSSAIAEVGFAAEEAGHIPLDDPSRDFKDPHHKPEMVYALTRFETLVGLRASDALSEILTRLGGDAIARTLAAVAGGGPLAVLRELLSNPPSSSQVDQFVRHCSQLLDAGLDIDRAFETAVEANRFFPGDPGVVVTVLLNRLTLEPGEAAFIGPGLLHAHFSGLCLEVMASSDNVMRAGLTPKRVNPQAVLKIVDDRQPGSPLIAPVVQSGAHDESTRTFVPPGGLFALSLTRAPVATLPGAGRRIVLCIDGEVSLESQSGDALSLKRGQAAFVDSADGSVSVAGDGELAQAYVPV